MEGTVTITLANYNFLLNKRHEAEEEANKLARAVKKVFKIGTDELFAQLTAIEESESRASLREMFYKGKL